MKRQGTLRTVPSIIPALALAAATLAAGGVGRTHALTVVRSTHGNANETVVIGKVAHGEAQARAWACFHSNTFGDTWVSLHGTGTALNDDYEIHGDSADTGTGVDSMQVLTSSQTLSSGTCNGSWTALDYNGHWLDLYGDGGGDILQDASSNASNDTQLHGGAGDDQLYGFSTIGVLFGEGSNDALRGDNGSNATDDLQGGDGDDCLQDATNTWTTFDCGLGSDRYYFGDTGAGKVSCESSSPSCCGFC